MSSRSTYISYCSCSFFSFYFFATLYIETIIVSVRSTINHCIISCRSVVFEVCPCQTQKQAA
ncbi:hypothetical protein BCR43DRAFT_489138 [Syncephalastrum racemosum]|uniref:Uncharacterized protein n=1 Tax=Syncephalastrum racemosum TaxID=13706 RepID=A0A1X2HJS9_SYNRA|nr:hypothetical protein BCR43DRAFT_489138 [Syncephalastrum racemosum]